MSMSDPVGDLLTRIRNGQRANKNAVMSPSSKLRANVLEVLKREGYIRGYESEEIRTGLNQLRIELKYHDGKPVIENIKRISRPGLRIFKPTKNVPLVKNGLGICIISTSKGIMSDKMAREQNCGGEIICYVS